MPLGSFGEKLRARKVNPFSKGARSPTGLPVLEKREITEQRYQRIFGETRSVLAEDAPPSRFPIYQLPSELLAEVFYWYISAVRQYSYSRLNTSPSGYSWLTLGHVCRAWRGVLLGYPKLYTYIYLTRPECVKEMILRAGDLALQIHDPLVYTMDDAQQYEINTLVLTHILRCTTADLILTSPIPHPVHIPLLLQDGTSQLRELNLQFYCPDHPREGGSPTFPNMKFPHLHSLTCSFVTLHSIRNMLHTRLRRLDISRPGRVSPDQLLAAIAPLQALEELRLRDACVDLEAGHTPAAPEELVFPPQHAIVLTRLRRLVINDYWSDQGIHVLHRLVYPASASVQVHLRGSQPTMFDLIRSVVIAKLCGQGVLGAPLEPQSISLLAGFDIKLHLTMWAHRQTLAEIEHKRYAAQDAYFQLSVSLVADERAVAALVRQLPLATTRTAMLAEQVVDAAAPLARTPLLAGLPLLEELQLEYEAFDDAAAPPAGVFARLEVLRVHELHHAQALRRASGASELAHLARWLAARDSPRYVTHSRRSDFPTVPLCFGSCAGSHTVDAVAPLPPMPMSDLVPCVCLPRFYLVSGVARVLDWFTRRRA